MVVREMEFNNKKTLGNRVWRIANKLNIPIVTVERILKSYLIELRKEDVKLGKRVLKIANKLSVPRVTVENVLKEYLIDLQQSGLNLENIVIDGIVSIKILKLLSSGDLIARSRISPALKEYLQKEKAGLEDRNILIDGIASIKVVRDPSTGEITSRARLLPAFRSMLSTIPNVPEQEVENFG